MTLDKKKRRIDDLNYKFLLFYDSCKLSQLYLFKMAESRKPPLLSLEDITRAVGVLQASPYLLSGFLSMSSVVMQLIKIHEFNY